SKYFKPDTPPEVREMITQKWGHDQPARVRYGRMLGNLATGDFGRSSDSERPVMDLIKTRLPASLLLSATTLAIVFAVGIAIGTLQAVRQYSVTDSVVSAVSLFFYSM